MAPAAVFLWIASVTGVALTFLTPPFQVPDEPVHFARAALLAEGDLQARRTEHGGTGGFVPCDLSVLDDELFQSTAWNPETKTSIQALLRSNRSVDWKRLCFEPVSGAAVYTPFPYVFSAAGIVAARALNLPALGVFWLGRFTNLFACVLLVWFAIRLTPVHPWTMAFLALLPISIFLRSSYSADALTVALSYVAIASALRFAIHGDSRPSFVISAVLLPFTKVIYAPIALIAALSLRSWREKTLWFGLILVSVTSVVAVLVAQSFWSPRVPDSAVNAENQIEAMVSDPLTALRIVSVDLVQHAPRYAFHLGRLGWLETPIHVAAIGITLAILLGTAIVDRDSMPLSYALRFGSAALFVIVSFTIVALEYITWTPVGSELVEGVQGRYFLPILPLALLTVYRRGSPIGKQGAWLLAVFLAMLQLVVLWTVFRRYYSPWVG